MSTMRSLKFRWFSRLLFTVMLLSLGLGVFTAVPASNAAVAAQFIRHSIDDNVNWLYDGIQLADMDGDDDLDAITAAFAGCLVWWENEPGNTGYWEKHILTCDSESYSAVPADLDGDDDTDILASLSMEDDIVWFENLDGSGTNWAKHHIFGHEMDSDILLAVDVDGDNDLDILAGLTYNHEIAWWENLFEDASSWSKHEVTVGVSFHALAAADIDGDGDLDLLNGTYFEGEVAWWENLDGNGRSWLRHFVGGDFPQPYAIGAVDMDNDGSMDIYGAALGGHKITWWRNVNGNGQLWEAHAVVEAYGRPRDVVAVDIDADRDVDLVSVSTDLNQVTLWENVSGTGITWQAVVLDSSFLDASAVTAGDIDGDGDMDVAAVAFNETGVGDNIAWWEQETAAFVVNSIGDGADTHLGDGLCDDGTGHCTLRAALMEANADTGIDLIHFNIPGTGPHTIRPYSPLPALTEGVIIDGYTQPGAQPNSNPAPQSLNTQLKVVLDGSQAGDSFAFTFGLDTPTIDGLVIRGLAIHSFGLGAIGALYEEMYDVTNARFVGNFLGTDVTGTMAQGGGSIHLAGGPRLKNIYVGGPSPEDRNLINGQVGIYSRYAEQIQIQGNLIGTDISGQHSLGSGGGVYVRDACPVLIGGAESEATNVISGNRWHGIGLEGNDGCTTVLGNLIGLASDGYTPLGNEGSGIYAIEHGGIVVEDNYIAYNKGNGLTVLQYAHTYQSANPLPNAIYANGGLGIDLLNDGVTPNDPLDSDVGPNGLQNYPILESVIYTADSVYVTGELHSKPNQNYLLVFFTNERCDASGYGEGEAFATELWVRTDGNGNGPFTAVFPQQSERPFITVTASLSSFYGTSEFSNCRADPLYLIALLQAEVQQLIDEGELPLSAGTKLLTKLANVTVALQAGHENTAVLRLRDFIASVNTLMNRRQLDRALGQPLVDAAWEVIRQINLP